MSLVGCATLPQGRLEDQRGESGILQRHGLHGRAERRLVGNRIGRLAKSLGFAQERPISQSQHHGWQMVPRIFATELRGKAPRALGIRLPLSQPGLHAAEDFGHGRFHIGGRQRAVAQLFRRKDIAAEIARHPDPYGLGLLGIHRSGEILDNRFLHENGIDEAAERP
ncbi:hypothetical protein [Devosia sp.]|uniref:hypothetical protein n=1 Tax=Devosia sp. TaxID=1871048 RepID=UPI0025DB5273|nr:hypothetical protein [Devosia sp.]MCR6634002.1 hypothetical protein [Devosia sp.]